MNGIVANGLFAVIPAKAGDPYRMVEVVERGRIPMTAQGVWVPAFAGTTTEK